MRLLQSVVAAIFCASLFAGTANSATVDTHVDPTTRTVRLDFADLEPYEQIRLEGVTALDWCNCVDLNNPSSSGFTGFTVNGPNLEMQYEGSAPDATNSITYRYLAGFEFVGFENVEWIVISELAAGEVSLVGNRPILTSVPEPSTGLLCALGLAGLAIRRTKAS